MLSVGDCVAGQYDVLEEIGTGSFGVVYRARQRSTGQLIALKVLRSSGPDAIPPRHIERFRRELALCARLEHPHVVRLIDCGSIEGTMWAAFAHVPGRSLRAVLDAEGCLGWPEAVRFMAQVADALVAAHALGIVHRDLKPENILVTASGGCRNVVIVDFGLGGLTEGSDGAELRLTATHEMLGTPCYAAPEQLRGEKPTPRSDVYSWGLIFIECLTGAPAVSGASTHEVVLRQMGEQMIPIPIAIRDPTVRALLATATHKRADERTITMGEILTTLGTLPSDPAGHALPLVPPVDAGVTRRQVAVLCVGLDVGGRDGAPLDPEDEHAVLRDAFQYVATTADRHGGRLVQALGTVAVVCFGHATAREQDLRRAAHTALDVVAGIERLQQSSFAARGASAQVRAALHVGVAILSSHGDAPVTVLGTTVQDAVALQASVAPGQIAIRDEIRRGLQRWFRFDPHPAVSSCQLLVGEKPAAAGEDTLAGDEATPLVGRTAQLERLLGMWRDVVAGRCGGVLLVGEPGIGKSRLVRELRRELPPTAWIEFRCTPEAQGAPLRPVIDWIAGLEATLPALLERLGWSSADDLAVLRALVHPAAASPLLLTRERQKEVTLQTLLQLFESLAREQPIALAFEDLHWADPTTLELITQLAALFARPPLASAPAARGGLVMTARLEFPLTTQLPGVSPLPLLPLTAAEVEELAGACVESKDRLTASILEALVREADGVPLFVEEVARVLSDPRQSADVGHEVPVPSTLWDLLASRLDRLSASARQTAQLAAVIGREFDTQLLGAVAVAGTATLTDDLDELVRAGIVQRRRGVAAERLAFKHALLRDAAYQSSMRSERQRRHARVASVLQGQFPEIERSRPELLAWHLEQAGDAAGATTYRRRAGDLAMPRGAYVEAIDHYRAATRLVARVPDRAQRLRLELAVTEALGSALFTTQGYAAPEVEATFRHAESLCDDLGADVPLRVLYGLWGVRLARSDPLATATLLQRFRALAARSTDPVAQVVVHSNAGTRAFLAGQFVEAVAEMRACLERNKSIEYRSFVEDYGYDVTAYAHGYLAGALWALGHLSETRHVVEEMLEAGERSRNPYSLTVALSYGAHLGKQMRDIEMADALSRRGIAVATEQRLFFWLGPLSSVRGWVTVQQGDFDAGIGLIEQGLSIFSAAAVRATYRCYLAYLVEALLAKGAIDEGLAALSRNVDPELPVLDVFCEPDLMRLQGELLLARGDRAAARATLVAGLEMARGWQARTFELRLTISLARLLAAEGDMAAARGVLQPFVAAFASEREHADVREANELLKRIAIPR